MTADHWGQALAAFLILAQTVHIWAKWRSTQKEHSPFGRRWQDRVIWRIDALERRMEEAGEKMSDVATKLQALPEELRKQFLSLEMSQEYAKNCSTDRAALHDEIKRLQDDLKRGPRRLDAQR